MSVIIEVDAEEMRKACAGDVDKIAIEIPGAVSVEDALCNKCGEKIHAGNIMSDRILYICVIIVAAIVVWVSW